MRIYLVQHGLALDARDNPERPLSPQGLEDVTRTAGFLSLFEKPKPLLVVHSGKKRAQQTAEMFAQAWQVNDVRFAEDLSPNDDPEIWANKLQEMSDDIMIVGHLPYLPKLASLLIRGDSEVETVKFRNGGVLCLEKSDASYTVLWHINPTMFYETDNE